MNKSSGIVFKSLPIEIYVKIKAGKGTEWPSGRVKGVDLDAFVETGEAADMVATSSAD